MRGDRWKGACQLQSNFSELSKYIILYLQVLVQVSLWQQRFVFFVREHSTVMSLSCHTVPSLNFDLCITLKTSVAYLRKLVSSKQSWLQIWCNCTHGIYNDDKPYSLPAAVLAVVVFETIMPKTKCWRLWCWIIKPLPRKTKCWRRKTTCRHINDRAGNAGLIPL